MNPIISCSVGNSSVIPGVAYLTRKNNSLTRLNFSRSSLRHGSSTRRFLFPSFVVNGVFPQNKRIYSYRKKSRTFISATETEVSVEVQDSPVADEVSGESPSNEVGTSEDSSPKSDANTGSAKAKRSRRARKSEMPPVKNEDLVPGAAFTGKVKSIQPFGAFVDFGAFTDGLVHISMLSDSFVKDVSSVVSLGQEVTVKVIEVNAETNRISLSMRENTDTGKRNDAPNNNEKSGYGRRDSSKSGPRKDKKNTKFVVGQELQGTVKNMTRSGTFISLPEGEEGFLPLAEEDDGGFGKIMGKSSLEIGREVSVRVLRITRGQATLTMKKEGAAAELDEEFAQVGDDVATNPFVLAFRRNKDIAKFLDQREKLQSEIKSSTTEGSIINGAAEKETEAVAESLASEEDLDAVNSIIEEAIQTDIATSNVDTDSPVEVADESLIETDSLVEVVDQIVAEEEKLSETDNGKEEFVATTEADSDAVEPGPVVTESEITLSAPAPQETPDDNVAAVPENNEIDANLSGQNIDLSPEESLNKDVTQENNQVPSPESPATEEVQEQTPVSAQVEDEAVAIASETNSNLSASDEGSSKATISPALVKQLRDETGAGMMDCKNALSESEGDIIKAQELLRKKGLASADKKATRATAEGRIGSYIHDSRIGVLVEVNCETDFVSRGEIFKELVDDIAMQVAACPQVEYVVTEDVPEEFVKKETEIEMQKDDLASKPEQIRSRIVEGRIRKRLEDLALLEQPYIKNDKVTVKDMVKQTIATIGENMKVTRFVRFNLGEGLEKKSQDFAAEVAAQTSSKPVTTPVTEEPAAAEAKETEPKKSTVVVSASLVKQLREETGAGMMDCKKALAETEGDLEKAQAYLRKKGLSSADKKSGRLAAEGRIGTYIHDARIGVLIEVNCETDFVGRSEKFKELVDDLAMQVAATRSIKLQLPSLSVDSHVNAGDASSESVVPDDTVKTDKTEDTHKERTSKKSKKKEKEPVEKPPSKSQIKKRLLVLPLETSIIAIVLLVLLGAFYVVHSVWAAAEAYSAPSIVLTSHSHDGLHVFDDFREAYAWLSHNTEVDDKVASWWDYGYQTTAMANRTVIVDNNTWNNTHIATVGTAMSSPEKAAWEIFNSLDVKYVLVVFGGLVGYPSDDINKFLWMVRIGGGVFPHIKEPDYLRDGQYRIDNMATPTMLNCLMYKLSYYRFVETDGKAYDRVRRTEIGKKYFKLTHFEEVFTTHHWMVRIYKLKPPKNRIRGKTKKTKSKASSKTVSKKQGIKKNPF